MLGAPPGFIPTSAGNLINVRSIDSVFKLELNTPEKKNNFRVMFPHITLDLDKELIAVKCAGDTYYMNLSVQQFAARIVKAMSETQPQGK